MHPTAEPTRQQLIRFRGRSYVAFVFTPVVPIVSWLEEIDATLARSPGFFIGRPVVLGVRPECIAEPTRHFGDAPGTTVMIDAPVEMIEPTGAETIVVLRLGEERALGQVLVRRIRDTGVGLICRLDARAAAVPKGHQLTAAWTANSHRSPHRKLQ